MFSEQKCGKENEYGTTAGEVVIRNEAYMADNIAETSSIQCVTLKFEDNAESSDEDEEKWKGKEGGQILIPEEVTDL